MCIRSLDAAGAYVVAAGVIMSPNFANRPVQVVISAEAPRAIAAS